jgi:hypothetical protein
VASGNATTSAANSKLTRSNIMSPPSTLGRYKEAKHLKLDALLASFLRRFRIDARRGGGPRFVGKARDRQAIATDRPLPASRI